MFIRRSRKILLYLSVGLLFVSGITIMIYSNNIPEVNRVYSDTLAEKITLSSFHNLYKLSDSVYRAEQPSKDGMLSLDKYGMKSVLNLRNFHSDVDEAKGTRLELFRVAMQAGKINEDDILQSMVILQKSSKPVLIHCLHGSDRTGCMVASYRILFQGWPKEKAIQELRNPAFGYHESWFPNIVKTLEELDVVQMRKKLGLNEGAKKINP